MTDIHKTAIVSSDAELANDVTVGPYSIIEGPVKIGKGTSIAAHAIITDNTTIGENCKISPGAVIGTEPQDLKFEGEESEVKIGNNVTIREYVTINRATEESRLTCVGDNSLLMAYVHVAHDCHLGKNVILANTVQMGGHVHIHDYAIIGGVTALHQFVSVGAHSMIGGGYRATMDMVPYGIAMGYPLKIASVNRIGLERRGFSKESIDIIKSAFRILFNSPYNTSDAVKKIQEELPLTEEIKTILDFIARSRRGIIK
ncbi:MAG: acyl-ACP--UDP-N-acetylglucosamine O-acyltransferase [candidate division Zixibacteria bacterium]|nr:acyl-ACP--UDP-N-acetylglucosamine O-acyltransferase [candidate division Zixibacteria bacterium]